MSEDTSDPARAPGAISVRWFRDTRWSLVLTCTDPAGEDFRAALEELVHMYRRPIHAWFSAFFRCEAEDADDLTQGFLTRWVEAGTGAPDPEVGRFRVYLRGAMRNYALKYLRREGAARRGGSAGVGSLVGDEQGTREPSPEDAFDEVWRRDVLEAAVADMEEEYNGEGRPEYAEVFRRYYLAYAGPRPTHAALAAELGLTASALNSRLAHVRARLRRHLERRVRDSVRDEAAMAEEMAALLGEGGGA